MATKTLSKMECSIKTIIDTFHRHTEKEGHPDTLSKKEFKELVQKDLGTFMKKEKRCDYLIKDIMEDLDTNADNQLSFNEYVMLIAKLTYAAHEKLHEDEPRGHDHSHGSGFAK